MRQTLYILLITVAFSTNAVQAAEDIQEKSFELLRRGDVNGAIKCFEQALKRNPDDLDSLLGMARALKENKRLNEASHYYRNILKLRPANRIALLSLVDILNLDTKTRDESMSLLSIYLSQHPADFQARRRLAFMLRANPKRQDEAVKHFKILVEQKPQDAEAILALARVLDWKPTWPQAEPYYLRYLTLRPNDYATRAELASLYAWEKRSKNQAVAEYNKLLAIKDDPKIRLKKALLLAWNGGGSEALTEFKKLAERDPRIMLDGSINGRKGKVPIQVYAAQVARFSAHDYRAAELLYESYLKRDPNNVQVRTELANLFWESAHQPQQAIEQLDLILKLEPHNLKARSRKVLLLFATGQSNAAIPELRTISELRPLDPVIEVFIQGKNRMVAGMVALGRVLDVIGKSEEAKKIFERYLALRPQDSVVRQELENMQNRSLYFPWTAKDVDKLLQTNPTNPQYRLQKAVILMAQGQFEQALPLLQALAQEDRFGLRSHQYVQYAMRDRPVIVALGICLARIGYTKEAQKVFQEYLSNSPDDQAIRLELATLLGSSLSNQDRELALEQFHRIIETSQDSIKEPGPPLVPIARLELARTLSAWGRHQEALKIVSELIEEDPDSPKLYGREGEWLTPLLEKAVVLIDSNQSEMAENLLREYLAEHKSDLLARRLLCQALGQQQNKQEEALAELYLLQNSHPFDQSVQQLIAHTLNQLKRYDQAISQLRALEPSRSRTPAIVSELAYALKHQGKTNESITLLRESLLGEVSDRSTVRNSERIRLACQLGEYLIDSQKPIEAERTYTDELKYFPDVSSLCSGLACALAAQGQIEKAKPIAEKSLAMATGRELIWRAEQVSRYPALKPIAVAALRKRINDAGEPGWEELACLANLVLWDKATQQEGIEHLRRYLTHHPNDTKAWRNLANVLAWSKNLDESLSIYKRLIEQQPDDLSLRFEMARAEMASRKTRLDSIKHFELYLKFCPQDIEARHLLADSLGVSGNTNRAITIYHDLLKEKPNDPSLLIGLAHAEVGSKATKNDGIKHIQEYLKLKPEDQEAKRFLAQTLSWTQGQEKTALRLYEELKPEQGQGSELKREYAILLSRCGKGNKAVKFLRHMLAYDQNDVEAFRGLAEIYSQWGDIYKAESFLEKARRLYPNNEQIIMLRAFNFKAMGRYDLALKELRHWRTVAANQE